MNNQDSVQNKQNNDDEIDLLELVYTILSRKWTIILFTLFSLFLAFIYAFGQVPVYSSNTLLQVESKNAVTGIEDIAALSGLGGDNASVATEIELLKSRKNLTSAIDKLHLDISATPKRVPLFGNLYKKFLNSNEYGKPPLTHWKWLDNIIYPYAWGEEKIEVTRLDVPDSLINEPLLLIITDSKGGFLIRHDDKDLLKGKLNSPSVSNNGELRIFVRVLEGVPGTIFKLTKSSKLGAIVDLQKRIKASEKGKKTGIILLQLDGEDKQLIAGILDTIANTYLNQNKSRSSEEASKALKFLEEQAKPLEREAAKTEANLRTYRTRIKTADISKETQAVLDVVAAIDTGLQRLSLQRDDLSRKYTANHPVILSIATQEARLNQRKKKTLSKISKLPETQQTLLKLERDFKVANTVYQDLLNKIQEFKIAKASSVGNVYIVDSAVASDLPVKPKKSLILALGALLGMMFSIMYVFLRKALHHTVNNPEKLEETLGIPVYATVPLTTSVKLTSGLKKNKKQKTLLAQENSSDPAIESLRSLRTSLHFALLEAKNNIVMITGPSPGIGKSFISSNFAAVLAATEQKVLLIDADMRKGYLHNLLNKKMSPGLSDLISKKTTIEKAIHTVQIGDGSMDIITRGQTPPNPSELLMHDCFSQLLEQFSQTYDLVLIDTPPVLAVTDPTIIGKHAGVTFMVIFSDLHHIKEIEHSVTRLSQNGIETKGFIFNGFVQTKSSYGSYGGYGYGSYYGDYKSDNG